MIATAISTTSASHLLAPANPESETIFTIQ
jgi:hypothetical protein